MDMPCAADRTALETLGIGGLSERVYLALLMRRMATATEIAELLRVRQSLVRQSLAQIERKGLASHTPQSPRVYIVIEPNFAIDALMKQRQMALERVRTAIPALVGKPDDYPSGYEKRPILELIDGVTHLKSVLDEIYDSFKSEIMIFRCAPILVPTLVAPDRLLRGVRVVADRTFIGLPGAPAVLRQAVARGEQVRTFTTLPFKMMIADRATAVVVLDRTESEPAFRFVIHGGPLLQALCALFECLWSRSTPVVAAPGGRSGAPRKYYACPAGPAEAVVPLLAAGLNDKTIAQELGISASTLNRRIAELMTTFGAKTRFQLGLQLGLRSGSVRSPAPPARAA